MHYETDNDTTCDSQKPTQQLLLTYTTTSATSAYLIHTITNFDNVEADTQLTSRQTTSTLHTLTATRITSNAHIFFNKLPNRPENGAMGFSLTRLPWSGITNPIPTRSLTE
eukprot:1713318-Amphidinium_carterae.1